MSGEFRIHDDGFHAQYRRLDEGWRRHLAALIGLPADGFQLLHGAAGQWRQRASLNLLADAVASPGAALRWTGARRRSFSSGYARLLGALRADVDGGLQGYLGADYADWVHHRNRDTTRRTLQRQFADWSAVRLPARRHALARRLFDEETAACALHAARTRLASRIWHTPELDRAGALTWQADFAATPAAALDAMFPLRDGTVRFDSGTLTQRNAPIPTAGAAGAPRILPGVVDGCLDPLERRALSGRIIIEGQIARRSVIDARPRAWYDADLVEAARHAGPDSPIWDRHATTGHWRTFFGPQGLLAAPERRLVFLGGLDVTITLCGPFAPADAARVAAVTRQGIWPFTAFEHFPDLGRRVRYLADGRIQVRLRHLASAPALCCARILPLSL